MAVWYLDNDDEITDAVARLRSTSDERVVFVVPSGSRIATGRINFKLLAREASSRDLTMAIASPDEQVRSLAMAAGVLGLPSADEAEAALERGDEPPTPETTAAGTAPPEPDTADTEAGDSTGEASARRRRRVVIGGGLALGLVVVGGVAALQVLPTAEVTIVPRMAAVGPLEVPVVALTTASAVDAERGVIPAVDIAIPLRVEGTFPASGRETTESRATGEVVFSAAEQSFDQEIAAGTRVESPAGIAFRTTAAVVLSRPEAGTGAAQVTAPIEALDPGEDGNVAPLTISVVPSLASTINVTNPEATAGGEVQQRSIVTRADYDAAAVDLQNRLSGELAARLRDPDAVPAGLTLYPETARLGPVTHAPEPEEVVGRSAQDFELSSSVQASVLAVDRSLVDSVAGATLAEAVPEDMVMDADSVTIDIGDGTADGQRIEFLSLAAGDAHMLIDSDTVLAQVAGLPVSEARAILERLGTVTVTVWPDFIGALPGDGQRITLEVQEPS